MQFEHSTIIIKRYTEFYSLEELLLANRNI